MDESIRRKLCDLIARRGVGLCATPEQCKQAVQSICRRHPAEKYLLLSILELGLVNEILALSGADAWPALQDQLVNRLANERALNETAARWGLSTWALALEKIDETQLGADVSSLALGADVETRGVAFRLLISLLVGAVVGSMCWILAMAVAWGIHGSWGPWGGALIGAGIGIIRGSRDEILSPLAVGSWALGGFLAAVLVAGMQIGADTLSPLTGASAYILSSCLFRSMLVLLASKQPQRLQQAVLMGGVLAPAIGWAAAALLVSEVVQAVDSPWSWCAVGVATGILYAVLDFTLQSWSALWKHAFVRGMVGALAGLIVGYISDDGGFLAWPIAAALIWAVPGTLATHMDRHLKPVWGVAYSPKGDFALSASADGTIGLWQMEDRSLVGFYQGHDDAAYCVAFSHDGSQCASGSSDATVRVVDGDDGEELHCFTGHTDTVLSVAFSPNDSLLASGSADMTVRLWDLEKEKEALCCHGHTGPVTSVAFAPEAQQVASASLDGSVRLWEIKSGREFHCFGGLDAVHSIAFTPDGKGLVAAGAAALSLFDVAARKVKLNFAGHTGPVHGAAVSMDGRRLLSAGDDGTVRLWDLASGKEIVCLGGHVGPVRSVAFAPNGRSALSGGDDGTVRLLQLPLPG